MNNARHSPGCNKKNSSKELLAAGLPSLALQRSLRHKWKSVTSAKRKQGLHDRWPTVAPPMRDSFGEVACLDSQPHLPPCDSALMRVAAYGFVFFIYENPFPGSRYMHFDPHTSMAALRSSYRTTRELWRYLLHQCGSRDDSFEG